MQRSDRISQIWLLSFLLYIELITSEITETKLFHMPSRIPLIVNVYVDDICSNLISHEGVNFYIVKKHILFVTISGAHYYLYCTI